MLHCTDIGMPVADGKSGGLTCEGTEERRRRRTCLERSRGKAAKRGELLGIST
jgi:hypothetical protein